MWLKKSISGSFSLGLGLGIGFILQAAFVLYIINIKTGMLYIGIVIFIPWFLLVSKTFALYTMLTTGFKNEEGTTGWTPPPFEQKKSKCYNTMQKQNIRKNRDTVL